MIGIQLEGDTEFLDTLSDTSIELTLNNPLLGDAENISPGSYSMPFKLPAADVSPSNEAKLNHPAVLENNAAFQIQKASLFYDGVPFKKGNLKVNATDAKNLDTYFTFGLNAIDPNFKTARLRDIMDENVVIDASVIVKIIYVKKTVNSGWSITINGKNYSGTDASAIASAINNDRPNFSPDSASRMAPYADLHLTGATPGGLAAPYIGIKLRQQTSVVSGFDDGDPNDPLAVSVDASETANYQFESFDMTAYYNAFKTFLSGYLTGAFPSDKYRFPVMFNANLYDGVDSVTKSSEVINAVSSTGLLVNDWVALKNHNSLQPVVLLKYALDKIAAHFNFSWDGDFYSDAELPNMLIDSSVTLDLPQDFIGSSKFVFWRRDFNINELVPDITVVELLKGLASRYNLAVYFNEITQKVRLCYKENIAKASVYDEITPLSSPVTNIEDQRVTGYTLICKKETTDLLSTVDEALSVGVPQETIEITCGRLQTSNYHFTDGLLTGPRTSRKNNVQGFGLRVFHFLGMYNNGAFSYQRADINGGDFYEPLADFIFNIGIYSKRYLYWLSFKKNWRRVTLNVDWPVRMLMKFDWGLKRRFDRSNFLVDSIKITMTNKSVQASEVTMYTMK